MSEGRTKKTIRNICYSFSYKLVDVLMQFLLRTIFIRMLGTAYLGIQGLFTNILTMLSLLEAGVGSATVFFLYEPLAKQDYGRVASLMRLYRRMYNLVGIAIALVGFAVTPLLPYIINLEEPVDNLYTIYWLTIASTSMTYFFSYRRTLLIADQRADVNTRNQIIFRITRFLLLSVVLIGFKSFILYLVADIVNSLASNIQITHTVKKRYRCVEEEQAVPLGKDERKTFTQYMSAGILSKFGQTIVNSTDSILISACISTVTVGLYSNYNLIFSNMDIVVYLLFGNVTAAVGSFAVEKSKQESKELFDFLYLINYMVVGTLSVCVLCLSTPFIQLWLGDEFVLHEYTVWVIALNFYLTGMCNAIGNFLSSRGEMTYKIRFRFVIEAVVNIIASLIFVLCFDWGILGVFLGTTVCYVAGRVWMDPYILYKNWFETPFRRFVGGYAVRFLIILVLAGVCKFLTSKLFHVWGLHVWTWLLAGGVCVLLCGLVLLLLFRKTKAMKQIRHRLFKR